MTSLIDIVSYLPKVNEVMLLKNVDGIIHEESIIEIQYISTVNWILGHIVLTRFQLLNNNLGNSNFDISSLQDVYDRGTFFNLNSNFLRFEELLDLFKSTHEAITTGLKNSEIDEKQLKTVIFLFQHESYHIGQIGLLRKLLGKESSFK